jgi:hypothetical protein
MPDYDLQCLPSPPKCRIISISSTDMIIRAAQIGAFQYDLLMRTLAEYARCRFPGHFQNSTQRGMSEFCTEVLRSARLDGISEAADISTVLDLTVMYGAHFRDLEWARDVFAASSLSPAEKIAILRTRVRRQVDSM